MTDRRRKTRVPGLTRDLSIGERTGRSAPLGGVCLVASTLALAEAARADEAWKARLSACVDYVRSGAVPARDLGVEVRPLAEARAAKIQVCGQKRGVAPKGNDARGLALREEAHDVLDPVLEFREADQWGPSDIWRGCAADGQEFRLSTMTQTTYADFFVMAAPHDAACAHLGS